VFVGVLRGCRDLGLWRVAWRLCLLLGWVGRVVLSCGCAGWCAVEGCAVVDGRVVVACGKLLRREALWSSNGYSVQRWVIVGV
jgi:hypothetical protein